MRKKLLALMLMAALTAPTLTGCGNAQQTAAVDTKETAQTETEKPAETECEHVWIEATCSAPKTCSVCGETEGEALPHTWAEATYAAPKTCTVCGETEGEPKQTYFQEHGVDVPDGPVDCTVDYKYFNRDNPETDCRVGDATFTQTDCYVEPADEEGYQNVHLAVTVTLQPGFYYDAAQNVSYSAGYDSGIYDWYTGHKLPARDMHDDDSQDYAFTLEIDGTSYEVSYSAEVQWEQGEWVYDEAGNGTSSGKAIKEYIFRIPEGYDGLVYAAIPTREYKELDTETVSGLEEAEYAALDPSDEDYVEGVQYFRINHTELPVKETETDADTETVE